MLLLCRRSLGRASLVALTILATPVGAVAQMTTGGRAANVAVNGALGAATAAVRQVVCGCLSWKGVGQGAAGGALMGVGKQVAATQGPTSGLIGRQVNALGVSAVASAGGEETLLLLPVGPLTLELRPGSGRAPRARVDVTDLTVLGIALLDGGMSVHWPSTWAAGAPVILHAREGLPLGLEAHGFAFLGTVFVLERFSSEDRRRLVAHEAVHVLQWDALRHLASHPAERVVVRQIPRVREAGSYLDMGLLAPASILLLGAAVPYHRHPWEREAYLLANGHAIGASRPGTTRR